MFTTPKVKFKINGLIKCKDYLQLQFGRRIEHLHKIKEFKDSAKVVFVSQKRRSHTKAWKEFMDLYKPTEWYCSYYDDRDCNSGYDDSIEIFYKTSGEDHGNHSN